MGRIIPHQDYGCIRGYRFGTPDVIHTDQDLVFRNELFFELSWLSQDKHSFATTTSKKEDGLVERANQEVMRHLRAMLFDARMHDKWSYEQLLTMVQRISGKLFIEKLSEFIGGCPIIADNLIGSDEFIRGLIPINLSETIGVKTAI